MNHRGLASGWFPEKAALGNPLVAGSGGNELLPLSSYVSSPVPVVGHGPACGDAGPKSLTPTISPPWLDEHFYIPVL